MKIERDREISATDRLTEGIERDRKISQSW